ncbi:MAG: hypothetical protein JO011_08625 [Ktedonobacteraceae bacterium]|nr:hypothetical protein [Ktedonobacteraceae bacterium]
MSGRIAHRPHYRHVRQFVPSYKSTRQPFFRTRWSYRRQSPSYEKRPLGYGLSLIPFGYYAARKSILPQF